MTWPPPPDDTDELRLVHLSGGGRVTARVVTLWGARVAIDEEGAVHCPGCWRFVPVHELSRPGNGHRVGLPSRAGELLPMGGVER